MTATIHADVLAVFNALVVAPHQKALTYDYTLIDQGVVTNFHPNDEHKAALSSLLKPLDVRTLFTREERENASLEHLLTKQFLHYIEVYGLNMPGLFDLEVDNGQLVSMRFVEGITVDELQYRVQVLLYDNAPVKDAAQLQRIIEHYGLTFDINAVVNNELRVRLWRDGLNAFANGDDAVRYLCLQATGSSLLIKSREVVAKMKAHKFAPSFFEQHEHVLAEVFNRHKPLILAAKTKVTATVINRIARRSKTAHVPLRESIAKTFVHKALVGEADVRALDHVTTRDKFKYLNLLAEKRLQREYALYRVRNGKVFYKQEGVKVYDEEAITRVEDMVLASLSQDLSYLRGKTILLDSGVDYGLPVSRKQTLGRLPFGTTVSVASNEISSGMYWENEWGARDLDLSGITLEGQRVGWGSYGGYVDRDIIFSGDITDARSGAMEFLTSRGATYGIVVNIFNGRDGSEMELVVGTRSPKKRQWMDETVIRERHALDSKNCLLGFVKGHEFVVYAGRMDNRRVSGNNPTLQAMETEFWTVSRLLMDLGIEFDVTADSEIEYDFNLSYEAFSYEKLEEVFFRAA